MIIILLAMATFIFLRVMADEVSNSIAADKYEVERQRKNEQDRQWWAKWFRNSAISRGITDEEELQKYVEEKLIECKYYWYH